MIDCIKITTHPFHYAVECTGCGEAFEISFVELRNAFRGCVPDEVFLRASLRCTCQIQDKSEPVMHLH